MISNDDQVLLAQECIGNLQRILIGARKVHAPRDYALMSEPILLEIQQREQEIVDYLSAGSEEIVAT